MLRRGSLKRTKLKRTGPKHQEWQMFRDAKAEGDRDEEGLLHCQDFKIGLPRCGIGRPSLDLHHVIGRNASPHLYYEYSNLVWLTRKCHDAAHNRG